MIRNIQALYESSVLINNIEDNFYKGNYEKIIKNINKYLNSFDEKSKCILYKYLAKSFAIRKEYSFAILYAKYALYSMPKDAESAYLIAKYFLETNERLKAQVAFYALSKIDIENKYTQEIMQELVGGTPKPGPARVPYEMKRYRLLYEAEKLFELGKKKNALKRVENFYAKNPKDIVLLNFLSIFYSKIKDFDKAKKYAQLMIEVDDYGVNGLCTKAYVLIEENENADLSHLFRSLISSKANSIDDIIRVSSLLSIDSEFDGIISYISKNNHILSYITYVIKSIAYYNLEKVDMAVKCIDEAMSIYGDFDILGVYKKYYLECEYSPLLISEFDKLPLLLCSDKKCYVANKYEFEKYDAEIFFKIDIVNHQDNIVSYIKNNKKHFLNLSDEFLSNFVSTSPRITHKTKSEILAYLIQERKSDNIKLMTDTGILDIKINNFEELKKAPKVLRNAYYIAVAYCLYPYTKFLRYIKQSFVKLYRILNESELKFTNSHLLAGAIMCDMGLFVSDDPITDVCDFMEISNKSLTRYMNEIKSCGDFANLDEDEVLYRHVSSMINDFGDIEKI